MMNGTLEIQGNFQFDWIEYSVFSTTLLLSALIGVYFGFIKGGQDTVSGYLFGGKQMTIFPIAMSLISSFTSGITLLGIPAEVYRYGSQYMLVAFTLISLGIVTAFVFLPVFFKLQLLSLYEYFQMRFDRRIRIITSILYTIALLTYIPIVIYVPVLAINQVSGIDFYILTPIICVICIFYTTVGGLKAVVWSDALQGGIMVFSVIVVALIGIIKVGGFFKVFRLAEEGGRINFFVLDPDPTVRLSFWSVMVGILFQRSGNTAINPASIQRFISLPSIQQARWSIVFLTVGCVFFVTLSGIIGLVMYGYYKDCDPYSLQVVRRADQMLPYFVMEVAGDVKGLPGLFLAGVVCAALSTMSTYLNTVAGTTYEDFIKPSLKTKPSEARASQIIKLIVVIFGIISATMVLLVEKLGGLIEMTSSFGGLTSGSILGLFILGLFFPSANTQYWIEARCGGVDSHK